MRAQVKHRQAYIRPTPRISEAKQLRAVIEAGATHIYIDGKQKPSREIDGVTMIWLPDARSMWLRAIRPGDTALVATLGRLHNRRHELAPLLKQIAEKGAALEEATTGRRSDNALDAAQMVADAVDELARENGRPFTSKTGREAAAKAKRRTRAKLSKAEAEAIWRDVKAYPTNGQAVGAMDGWSYKLALAAFGSRYGRDPSRGGRPRKTSK